MFAGITSASSAKQKDDSIIRVLADTGRQKSRAEARDEVESGINPLSSRLYGSSANRPRGIPSDFEKQIKLEKIEAINLQNEVNESHSSSKGNEIQIQDNLNDNIVVDESRIHLSDYVL